VRYPQNGKQPDSRFIFHHPNPDKADMRPPAAGKRSERVLSFKILIPAVVIFLLFVYFSYYIVLAETSLLTRIDPAVHFTLAGRTGGLVDSLLLHLSAGIGHRAPASSGGRHQPGAHSNFQRGQHHLRSRCPVPLHSSIFRGNHRGLQFLYCPVGPRNGCDLLSLLSG